MIDTETLGLALTKRARTAQEFCHERVDDALAILAESKEGIPWPWSNLTQNTDTICEGDLILVVAYTGSGKTTFLQNCLLFWSQLSHKVLYFGTEQSVAMLSLKWACMMLGIPFRDARRGRVKGGLLKRLKAMLNKQRETPLNNISFYPKSDPTPDDLEGAIRRAARKGVKIFVIDYLGRIALAGKTAEWIEGKSLMVRLKKLAVELKVVIYAAAQVNGDSQDRLKKHYPPDLDSIQWGKAPAREADIVIAVFQPVKKGLTEEERDGYKRGEIPTDKIIQPNTAVVIVLKQREEGAMVGQCASFWVTNNTFYVRNKMDSGPPEAENKNSYRTAMRKAEMDADPLLNPVAFEDEEAPLEA